MSTMNMNTNQYQASIARSQALRASFRGTLATHGSIIANYAHYALCMSIVIAANKQVIVAKGETEWVNKLHLSML